MFHFSGQKAKEIPQSPKKTESSQSSNSRVYLEFPFLDGDGVDLRVPGCATDYGFPECRQKKTDRLMNLWLPGGKIGGKDSQEVWDGHVNTAVFKMDNQQGPTAQHRELCSILCGSLDGNGVWGRMHMYICMDESLRCSSKTITTLLIGYQFSSIQLFSSVIGYTPIQNKKFKKNQV